MNLMRIVNIISAGLTALLVSSCAISPETQAKMDEYDRTIPSCSSESDCQPKWSAARAWVLQNSDFGIRGESAERIMATSNIISTSGLGVVVDRVSANGGYQITVDLECFSAYGCPNIWDTKLDFNRTVNAAN